MSWTDDQIAAAAEDLIAAERTGVQTGLMSLRHPGLDLDTAYRIQDALVAAKHFWKDAPPAVVGTLERIRERRFGETALSVYRRHMSDTYEAE